MTLPSSTGHSSLDAYTQRMLRPDSEVADMEARLGPASRYVDAVFPAQPVSLRGDVRDLVKLVPSGLLKRLLNTLASFSLPRRLGQRFIIDACASNRHTMNPPSRPLLTGEGLCHVEFRDA